MTTVLISIDDSPNALKTVAYALNRFRDHPGMEVHLLHVRNPSSQPAARLVSRRYRGAYHREEAERALASARRMLQKSGVPHAVHIEFGDDKARTIHDAARRLGADQILIATPRNNMIARMQRDPVTNKLLDIAHVPVEVAAGEPASVLRRYRIPAGIGAALGFLYLALE